MYGPDVHKPGSYAANCLLARRLAERGVRFIQLYHMGWDQHGDLPNQIRAPVPRHRPGLGRADQGPQAARAARGHAGHLGRRVRPDDLFAGPAHRDQLRPRPPPALLHRLAGRRRHQAGHVHGETDDFSYNIVKDPVEVYDLNATILISSGSSTPG